ncbi:unnamed protein product [Ambrosiozyma monospora]|uniref:Unnamed protein product n=1 Tax=Ambrosiozyma monospora TaxID=43982 RepID=A0ACB5TC38_AMBMO|nr:unnamed protein product [Ambrosiozyma monospora]
MQESHIEDTELEAELNTEILNRAEVIPPELKKYWKSRYKLFNRFDDGIQLTYELWFSVTPEALAIYTAKFIKHCYPEAHTIVDLFCGGGGNTIQFLKQFDKVIGIDNQQMHLDCTLNNALVYVDSQVLTDKLTLLNGNWGDDKDERLNVLNESGKIDIMFGSPPWGGPDYTSSEVYDVDWLAPLPLADLLKSMKKYSRNIVLFLPRNTNLKQIEKATKKVFGKESQVRITRLYVGASLKGLLCFWGDEFWNYTRK